MSAYWSPAEGPFANEMLSDSLISRTTKHTGAIKALQFNPFKSELLATAGAKGEVRFPNYPFMSQISNAV